MSKIYSLLYVEDDPGSRKVMRGLVELLTPPVQLTILENSEDFLEHVSQVHLEPDLFLLDIHVKPLNGFEMLSLLRQHGHYHDKMVVALTASVMNEEITRLKEAGFDGMLAKPLKFNDFPNLIERILQGEHLWTLMR
jgi:CheY-like chemotaxis protein